VAHGLACLLVLWCALPGAASPERMSLRPRHQELRTIQLAGLGESAADLFLGLVNDRIKGRLSARTISVEAADALLLSDATLFDPEGVEVARIGRGRVEVSLSSLLIGEVNITAIEIDKPNVSLRLQDGELNLLRALEPRVRKDQPKDSELTVEISRILLRGGTFRFANEGVSVEAFDIDASGRVDVDIGRKSVVVEVNAPTIGRGMVRLKDLDIPMRDVAANNVKVINQRILLNGVRGLVLGANLRVDGAMTTSKTGSYDLRGTIRGSGGHWPERLAKPAFDIPSLDVSSVTMTGPLAEPVIAIRGAVGGTTIAGYRLHGADVDVVIDRDQITFGNGSVVRTSRLDDLKRSDGSATVVGALRFAGLQLDVRSSVRGLPLRAAVQTTTLTDEGRPPRGVVDGTVHVTGVASADYRLRIDATLQARGQLAMAGVELDQPTVRGRIDINPKMVTLEDIEVSQTGIEATVSGPINLEERSVQLRLRARGAAIERIVPSVPKAITTTQSRFEGTIRGPYDDVRVSGALTIDNGLAYGVPMSMLTAKLDTDADAVRLQGIGGVVLGGALRADDTLRIGLGAKAKISGRFSLQRARLDQLQKANGTSMGVMGMANAEVVLSGLVRDPIVDVRVAAGGVEAGGEQLGDVTGTLRSTRTTTRFSQVRVVRPGLHAWADELRMNHDDVSMFGRIEVRSLDLATLRRLHKSHTTGTITGVVELQGDVQLPALSVRGQLRDGVVSGYALGSGSVDAQLERDAQCTRAPCSDRPLVVRVATHLNAAGTTLDARLAYALERDAMAAELDVNQLDVAKVLLAADAGPAKTGTLVEGMLRGHISLRGPLRALDGEVQLSSPSMLVARGDRRRSLGTTTVQAALQAGVLDASLCTLPSAAVLTNQHLSQSRCGPSDHVQAHVQGPLNLENTTFSWQLIAIVDDAAIEDFVPSLQQQDAHLAVAAQVDVQLERGVDGNTRIVQSGGWLDAMNLRMPGSPAVSLVEPVQFVGTEGVVKLSGTAGEGPARIRTATGDVDVSLAAGSSVSSDGIEARLQGTVDLAALKLLTNEVANAKGRARLDVTAVGRFENGVAFQGFIEPIAGSSMLLRSIGEPLQFDRGRIAFSPRVDGPYLDVVIDGACGERAGSCPMLARLRDAPVSLEGHMDVRTSRPTGDDTWLRAFDLHLIGNGVTIRLADGPFVANLDVSLREPSRGRPVLSGRVEINEGSLRREFKLRNFLLSEAPAPPKEPMWKRMAPYGLAETAFALDVSVRNVRTRAKLNEFSVDMSLRGELSLGRNLRLPSIEGTLEADDGTVSFPNIRFAIAELQAQFPTTVDGQVRPTLHLTATGEVPAGVASAVELPITFTIDGPLNTMQLDLTAVDDDHPWTRGELFALIFFKVVPGDVVSRLASGTNTDNGGVNTVSNLLVRELAAPVTDEVESFANKRLGLDVQLDVGGVQLQLGKRLSLESTFFPTTSSSTTTTQGNEAVRVRFLLLDHLPWGRSLAGDGRFGTTSDLRLTYRVFEQ
jgi:hypothetical protein